MKRRTCRQWRRVWAKTPSGLSLVGCRGAMTVALRSLLSGEGHQPGLTLTLFSTGESPFLTAPLVKRGLNVALIQM